MTNYPKVSLGSSGYPDFFGSCGGCGQSRADIYHIELQQLGFAICETCLAELYKGIEIACMPILTESADNSEMQRCICAQLTALEPVVNPDYPTHGPMQRRARRGQPG